MIQSFLVCRSALIRSALLTAVLSLMQSVLYPNLYSAVSALAGEMSAAALCSEGRSELTDKVCILACAG